MSFLNCVKSKRSNYFFHRCSGVNLTYTLLPPSNDLQHLHIGESSFLVREVIWLKMQHTVAQPLSQTPKSISEMISSPTGESAGLWRQQLPVLLAGESGTSWVLTQLLGQRLPHSGLCEKPVGTGDRQCESRWRTWTTRCIRGWN